MAVYAIGDVQGCYQPLMNLLELIQYSPKQDQLWFTGDLVNRGPQSLAVLRFIKNLQPTPIVVLGNHDLHLLAIYHHSQYLKKSDTLQEILAAPDVDELIFWLSRRPLLHFDPDLNFAMVHAGLPPQWSFKEALQHAREVEQFLQSSQAAFFFQHLYGNEPSLWDDALTGLDRLRFIVNCFTRLRFCDAQGRLNLSNKSALPLNSDDIPWFKISWRKSISSRILFGHWAALMGKTNEPNVYALDTGCVWGNQLTALRLNDLQIFQTACG